MRLGDRILDNIKTVVLLHEKLKALNERAEGLARGLDLVDRRLVRVETVLEFASDGRFRPRIVWPGGATDAS